MNIKDFSSPEEYPVDLLGDIFDKQRKLAMKYHEIEHNNGFITGDGILVNIHDKFGQHRIKDFAWRVTEELAEALEAAEHEDAEHCLEELSDSLHFMVELCLICNIPHKLLLFEVKEYYENGPTRFKDFREGMLKVIYHLGLGCNCLKNKPWKQSQILTDVHKFEGQIIVAFSYLFELFEILGIKDEEQIYDLYFRKNKVNQFRQESNY